MAAVCALAASTARDASAAPATASRVARSPATAVIGATAAIAAMATAPQPSARLRRVPPITATIAAAIETNTARWSARKSIERTGDDSALQRRAVGLRKLGFHLAKMSEPLRPYLEFCRRLRATNSR